MDALSPPRPVPAPRSAPFHPVTLMFEDESLEREFLDEYFGSSRRQVRAALGLIVVLFAIFTVLDHMLVPAIARTLGWIRIVECALATAVFGLSYTRFFDRHRELILCTLMALASAGIMTMVVVGSDQIASLYYVGLILAVMGVYAFFRLRFLYATIVAAGIILAWQVELLLLREPLWIVLDSNFFLLAAALIAAFASYALEKFARIGFRRGLILAEEQRRSDALLLNILPASIAERLKREQGPIAESFDDASVLFADIVGFTELSSRIEVEDLLRLLNRVFTEFDHIATEHGLEKIKTIGDAYMAAAGLPVRREDHLERVADAALDMLDRIGGIHSSPRLELRIGIAVGPVMAGVIGESKFIYDLWGDAVTLASRMESLGQPGRIQVTEWVKRRLAERYVFTSGGSIEIKGHGVMQLWFLDGRRGEIADEAREEEHGDPGVTV